MVVAFSGGADSAFLARVATDVLGREPRPVRHRRLRRRSPPRSTTTAALWPPSGACAGGRSTTDELDDPAYVPTTSTAATTARRACSTSLGPLAAAEAATVVLGVNLDDLGDHRPGQQAAAERGARFPLVDVGLHEGRRAGSRRAGSACAPGTSRPPPAWRRGSPTARRSPSAPSPSVAAAESGLRALGFRQLRVRHYGDLARIELDADELAPRRAQLRQQVVAAVRGAGYRYVTLDLEGFRSGNLNGLAPRRRRCGQAARRRPCEKAAMIDVRVKLTFPEDAGARAVHRPARARARRRAQHPRANVDEHEGWIVCEIAGEPAKIEERPRLVARPGVRVDLLGDVVES